MPADALEPGGHGAASGARPSRLAGIEEAHARETAGLRRDAAIAIAATAPLLVIAMAHGAFEGTPWVIAQLVLGTLVVLGPGSRYLGAGARAVRHGSPDMNTLIALGAGAAWLSSTIAAARWLAASGGAHAHMPDLYFRPAPRSSRS